MTTLCFDSVCMVYYLHDPISDVIMTKWSASFVFLFFCFCFCFYQRWKNVNVSGMLSPQGSLLIEWGFGLQSDSKYKILAVRGAAAGAGRRGGEEDKGTELRIALSWPKDMKWTTQKNAYSTPVLKKDSCTDILKNMSLNLLYLKWNKLLHKITWQDVSQASINRWSSADSHKKLREQVTWKLLCFLVFRNPLTKLTC